MNCTVENKYTLSIKALDVSVQLCCKAIDVVKCCLKSFTSKHECCPNLSIDVSLNLENVVKCQENHCCVFNILNNSCDQCPFWKIQWRTKFLFTCYFLELLHEKDWIYFGRKHYHHKCYYEKGIKSQTIYFCVERKQVVLRFTDFRNNEEFGEYFYLLGLESFSDLFVQCKNRSVPFLAAFCLDVAGKEQLNNVKIPKVITQQFNEFNFYTELFYEHPFHYCPD